jgi:hypothetical protein
MKPLGFSKFSTCRGLAGTLHFPPHGAPATRPRLPHGIRDQRHLLPGSHEVNSEAIVQYADGTTRSWLAECRH